MTYDSEIQHETQKGNQVTCKKWLAKLPIFNFKDLKYADKNISSLLSVKLFNIDFSI